MKKLLLPILIMILAFPAISMGYVVINGTVTDTATGNPIPNHTVTLSVDSTSGWFYYKTVYTNNIGYYFDTIPIQGGGGTVILFVSTFDCLGDLHRMTLTIDPIITTLTVDFSICNPCGADFTFYHMQGLTVQFMDASAGGGNMRHWSFGDGGTSILLNPLHTYAQPGDYTVLLTIGAYGTTCLDSIFRSIHVWDSLAGPCHAAFSVYPDSNAVYSYQFIDQSSGNLTSWNWNFGDGQTSSLQNPSHAYSQPGIYSACLSIQGADSTCFDLTCDTIFVGYISPCHAEFSYVQPAPLKVYFNNNSTGGNDIYMWNFGDGTYSAEVSPVHVFPSSGYYIVGLSIGDSTTSCFDFTSTMVNVWDSIGGGGCHAEFTYYGDSLNSEFVIQFVDQSTAGTGYISSWYWQFGDGTTSTLQNPAHTYPSNGVFVASLTIHGVDSTCFDNTSDSVFVGTGPGCHAYFTYAINPAPGNHTVVFTDLSLGNPESWVWYFGDGTMGNVQNPVHTYAAPGLYTVCLSTVENNCSSTFCQDVAIQDSIGYHQVYGQVFAGNFPVSAGLAMIFSFDTTGNSQSFVDVFPIDSNGVYYFTMVPDGNYYILAVPFDSMGYLPTYYGNVLTWEQATLIQLGTANNPYNINLLTSGMMTQGPGSASGQINMGGLKATIIDKVNMILMNEQGAAIGFTRVSTAGSFDFPSMAYGTYYLHPEMPGVASDQVMITLTPENPHASVVMTYNGNSIQGMKDEPSLADAWNVYPNPVTDHLTLSIDMIRATKAEVGIYNLTGQLLSGNSVVLHDGNNRISLSTASFPAGLYTLRVYSAEGVNIHAKLVKTR